MSTTASRRKKKQTDAAAAALQAARDATQEAEDLIDLSDVDEPQRTTFVEMCARALTTTPDAREAIVQVAHEASATGLASLDEAAARMSKAPGRLRAYKDFLAAHSIPDSPKQDDTIRAQQQLESAERMLDRANDRLRAARAARDESTAKHARARIAKIEENVNLLWDWLHPAGIGHPLDGDAWGTPHYTCRNPDCGAEITRSERWNSHQCQACILAYEIRIGTSK